MKKSFRSVSKKTAKAIILTLPMRISVPAITSSWRLPAASRCGEVVQGVKEIADAAVPKALKPITRMADSVDVRRMRQNREDEKRAYRTCQDCIARHGLEMKLVEAEYTLDRSKIMFYFTADGRVDFRELVKDLAGIFHTRIELRQIGVRDESKMIGGLGICGQPFCCSRFLKDFQPVSIKMAKEQGLSLNPTKISGACGRLMCCPAYEENAYEYLNSYHAHGGQHRAHPGRSGHRAGSEPGVRLSAGALRHREPVAPVLQGRRVRIHQRRQARTPPPRPGRRLFRCAQPRPGGGFLR